MSEIKFACPHCSQHIACDDLYCGERIDCPGCGRVLFIPLQAAFNPPPAASLMPRTPVGFKQRQYPQSSRLDVWTEESWEKHAAEVEPDQSPRMLPVWVLLFLPFVVGLILMTHRAGVVSIAYLFILCAIVSGLYLAKIKSNSGVGMILASLLYSFGMLCVYAVMSFGLLFVGCLVTVI